MTTQKSKEIDDLLTGLVGISRREAEREGICTFCKRPVGVFRNEISKREYQISGLCQKCQDDTFGVD